MNQERVQLVSTTTDSITIGFGPNRIEYFYDDTRIARHKGVQIRKALVNGWYNFAISILTYGAAEIRVNGNRSNSKEVFHMATAIDAQKTPSPEYPYTLIATTARSVTYRNDRSWFKSEDAAREHAQEIYDQNKNENFELAVVKCEDVIKPKPRTEIISTWKKAEATA